MLSALNRKVLLLDAGLTISNGLPVSYQRKPVPNNPIELRVKNTNGKQFTKYVEMPNLFSRVPQYKNKKIADSFELSLKKWTF